MKIFTTILLAIMLTLPALVFGLEITLDPVVPTIGEEVRVSLTGAEEENPSGYLLTATYRPSSATTRIADVGFFPEDGALSWTPESEGIVLLTLTKEGEKAASKNVAVRFDGAPRSGILVMVISGLILFGGAGYFFHRATKNGFEG